MKPSPVTEDQSRKNDLSFTDYHEAEGTGVFLGLLRNAVLCKGLIEIGFVSFLLRRKHELLEHVS